MDRRTFLTGAAILSASSMGLAGRLSAAPLQSEGWAAKLVEAAKSQIGVTVIYDPAYVGLKFPNGDVPRDRGVCSDVVIRAYRDAFGYDLQEAVHTDMKANFSSYPTRWGLKRPDRNIDHRRVLNLAKFFERQGARLQVSDRGEDFLPGDIIEQVLPGNLPHMAIVSDQVAPGSNHPMVIHNIGGGTRLEDRLFTFELTGHFRFPPPAGEGA